MFETGKRQMRTASYKEKRAAARVREQARSILKILLAFAKHPERHITYGELAKRTGVPSCALRAPMNHLSEALQKYGISHSLRIPPLQVVIVNQNSLVPGPGASRFIGEPYLNAGSTYEHLSVEGQKALIERIRSDIARFPHWKSVEADVTQML